MVLDTKEYLSVLRGLTQGGHEIRLEICGDSMFPFLVGGRDSVFFRRPDTPLKAGQIVFYQRSSQQFVLHRIIRITPEGLYLAGDAQAVLEGPISGDAVFARVTRVVRKGKTVLPGSMCWIFFSCFWRHCRPFRIPLMHLYLFSCRLSHFLLSRFSHRGKS